MITDTPQAGRSLRWMAVRSTAANVAMPLSAILTGPLLARTLGPDGRGAMAALLAPISLANLMFTCGVPESLTFHVARRQLSRHGAARFAAFGAAVCGGAALVIGLLLTPVILRQYSGLQGVMALMLLSLPVTLGFAALRGAVQGLRKFDSVSLERVASTVLRLGLLVALAVAGALTASVAAWVTILSGAAASLVLIPAFRSGSFAARDEVERSTLTRYAAGSALGTVGGFLILRLDQTLMAPIAGPAQLGYYAVAVSLAELPIMAVAAVRDMVFTVATDTDDPRVAARASRMSLLVMLPVCLAGVLVAPFVIPLLFGDSFEPAVVMTQILMGATFAATATAITGAGLMSLGRAGLRSAAQISGAVVTVILLIVLVPSLGGKGAAIASLLTYVLMSVTMVALFSRFAGLPMRASVVPTRDDVRTLWAVIRRRLDRS